LTLTVDNVGESVEAQNVRVTGSDSSGNIDQSWDSVTGVGASSSLSAGQSGSISAQTDFEVSIVYNDPNNDQSFTLQEDVTGPDA
jgi:hypothetical protein